MKKSITLLCLSIELLGYFVILMQYVRLFLEYNISRYWLYVLQVGLINIGIAIMIISALFVEKYNVRVAMSIAFGAFSIHYILQIIITFLSNETSLASILNHEYTIYHVLSSLAQSVAMCALIFSLNPKHVKKINNCTVIALISISISMFMETIFALSISSLLSGLILYIPFFLLVSMKKTVDLQQKAQAEADALTLRLLQIKKLYETGKITEEEYSARKNEILDMNTSIRVSGADKRSF